MADEEDEVPIKTPSNKMMLLILLTNIVGLGAIGAFLGLTRSPPPPLGRRRNDRATTWARSSRWSR